MIKLSDIASIPLANIKGDDSSSTLNPMHTASEYSSLLEDIRTNGQLQPIIICRNLVVDGRNRVRALKELGIYEVLVQEMPYKSSRMEKEKMAKSSVVARRHQSKTQLACKAVGDWNSNMNQYKQDGLTQVSFISSNNTNNKNFSLANYIYKYNKSMFDALLDGHSVNIDSTNLNKTTSSLTAIVAYLKHKDSEFNRVIEESPKNNDSKGDGYESSDGERWADAQDLKKIHEVRAVVETNRAILQISADSLNIPIDSLLKAIFDLKDIK